ncbi:SusC/RagA family TonB-linked outer membrane protein [Pedobacter gandavensis]|uniref:SusC/RagA family TonB-linked outer membrane protein n=1 Tax=Pedobacter gandavensis TaxID=2679963 RepID=A0ABR6F2B2_9SPHI|nr:SusC/RagA family TonB-linked outer membrane protein [Pedobacter gandavensis]MBB2151680.1 SusC/RagA family TonB-linked outer membrane protein [Pedobacter gandavensis]
MISYLYHTIRRQKRLLLLHTGIVIFTVASGNAQEKTDSLQLRQVSAIGVLEGGKAFTSNPTSSIYNALSGRLAGLYTLQGTGQPGLDAPNVILRGRVPLIVVDGIPRDLTGINPEQIASVTVLKDALSTAMYGNRGANGVLLITTKKGKKAAGYSFEASAQTGLSSSLKERKALSAGDYATLYNEALRNDGRQPIYTPEAIAGYKSGSDPFLFPNVNWNDQIFKNNAPFSRYNLNSEGSDKNVNYFISLDYLKQEGLLKPLAQNTYNTNTDYERFVFRTNLEMQLTPRLKGSINLYSSIGDQNSPGSTGLLIYNSILNTPSSAYPVLNPDGSLGGNALFSNNIYGQSVYRGYQRNSTSDGFGDLALTRQMDDVWKGWWIKANISFYAKSLQLIDRSKNFQTFQLQIDPVTGQASYQRYGTQTSQVNNSAVINRNQQFFAEGATGYSHEVDGNKLDVVMAYNLQSYRSNSQLPQNFNTGRVSANYSIKDKYVLEATGSYSGNNWYKKGKQYDFYPAGGLSWNLNNEDFFNQDGFLNTLKLRTTYGKVGMIDPLYYAYLYSYVNTGNAYYFGTGPSAVQGTQEAGLPSSVAASKSTKFDAGLDMGFANNRGYVQADYFINTYTDVLQIRGQASSLLGIAYPLENLGKSRMSGLEFTAGWKDKIGDVGYHISGNVSMNRSKIIENDEPKMPYSWMSKKGQPMEQLYGYMADGYVQTAGEGPVVEGYKSQAGDIKYKDLNNDGVINQYDVTAIGGNKPLVYYGFNLGFDYKNFEVSVLFQGITNRNIMVTGLGEWAFQNNGTGNGFEQHLNRWTPETASTASYPRLSVGPNINNNVGSSYWIQKANFLRLKNAEIAYKLQGSFLEKIKVKQVRLFVNGANLLTFSKIKRFDPEGLSLDYPLQRMINGGLTVKF